MSARRISRQTARRLAIAKQRLGGDAPADRGPEGLLDLVRHLGCLQIDPISAVAPTQVLVPWSRLGPYERDDLDRLLWQERSLFHYFAHAASLVPTADYPLHRLRMRRWPAPTSAQGLRIRTWLDENKSLRRHILVELRRRGPRASRDFEDRSA
ncbi:MAG: DNA glycosylase AlkZ-like family protein, partial [Actinomycetota bacterium]